MLSLTNLTELNARSARADALFYDEESQADEAAYRAGVSILAGSELGMIFHFSTPVKASIFEENHDRLKRREIISGEQFIFSCTWEDVGFLAKKKEWYEEQRSILPGWYFRQEHEASIELPAGAVFQNVIYDPYPDWVMQAIHNEPLCSGVDWNPASGHTLVSVKWLLRHHAVVVMNEQIFSEGYSRDMKVKEFYRLAKYFTKGNKLVFESGGINEEYVKWFYDMLDETRLNYPEQQFASEEWDNQDVNKLNACNYIMQNGITIYVDEMRFPETASQIEDCHWDEDAKGSNPKLAKDKANSPHYLDGFLHAISEKNRDLDMYEIAGW